MIFPSNLHTLYRSRSPEVRGLLGAIRLLRRIGHQLDELFRFAAWDALLEVLHILQAQPGDGPMVWPSGPMAQWMVSFSRQVTNNGPMGTNGNQWVLVFLLVSLQCSELM